MSSRFAAALVAVVVTIASAIGTTQAHEGHDHQDEAPAAVATAVPAGAESASDQFELVALPRGGGLDIYLDAYATNAPVEGASIEIEPPEGARKAQAAAGQPYRLEGEFLKKPGHYDLIATVQAAGTTDVLPLSIGVPEPAAGAPAQLALASTTILQPLAAVMLGIGIVLGLALGRILWRRGAAILALALLAGVILAPRQGFAHGGEDHGDDEHGGVAAASVAGPLARRLPDGSIYVPKPLQRIFEVRTVIAASGSHRRAIELPGRIIPDPNASGFVQAAIAGLLSPPPGGFPRLGTQVKAGDVLAYVTPPLQAIDRSDMRQRQGELDQQIAIVERRVARYEYLVPSGAATQTQLEEARLELQGLRDRRTSLDRARRESEALTAPVSGIIADGNPVAGQVAQANAVIFQVIDPNKLWVEALSYDAVADTMAASAQTSSGATLPLSFRGAGFADRSQSVPVHFAIDGEAGGLRAGQFVTVLVSKPDERKGIALPRTAVVRNANGQDFVFDHVGAERFEARPVRVEPLDGDRVLILAGLEGGRRVVVQGAELLNQVR